MFFHMGDADRVKKHFPSLQLIILSFLSYFLKFVFIKIRKSPQCIKLVLGNRSGTINYVNRCFGCWWWCW